ncbi:LacI family DNA-binding transcriptional regulator [Opacimonas viscosa]|uniref:LacI family DNA-binding transcriptional regulator n=1 Tax=Opacimonas viscosa TaxID=2961944 RepID=A0AA42BL38_9ALTE|nr:LacI family DNA-binding transcriptional regulator [Opacimonas viscosa]MCP3428438.1 LacI family DNA-binding transcriptional regulator [Opacimonas viscosa]
MATIYEVAELAKVSLATVSRVINGNVKVSPKTLDKVKAAMDELGYRPNSIAQSLASNRTNRVGVLVSELSGPFFSNMLSIVEQELRAAGKHAIIAAGHSDEKSEKAGIEFLLSCRCDALILHVDCVSDEYLLELHRQDIPFSIINHRIEALSDRCFTVDNEMGGYLAAKAVLAAGHRKIAYISGPSFKEDAQLRLAGHKRALAEYNIEFNEALHCTGNYQEEGGKEALHTIYQQNSDFTAVVCANDEMAVGAMFSARELGFSLPETLSIAGFDDLIFARYTYPTLATVHNPISDMGSMAAKWILREVYNNSSSEELINVFRPEFVTRRSLNLLS